MDDRSDRRWTIDRAGQENAEKHRAQEGLLVNNNETIKNLRRVKETRQKLKLNKTIIILMIRGCQEIIQEDLDLFLLVFHNLPNRNNRPILVLN